MSRDFVIVTDSTSNLSPGPAEALDIPIIPLNVHWEGQSYLDGVTLEADTFYRWLQARDEFPKTSQPSAGAFIDFFKEVAERYETDTILGIFISSDMSGTLASALQAREQLPDLHIELVDSRSVSMGLGLQVLVAVEAQQAGKTLSETLDLVKRCYETLDVIFAVDTLEFLHRGGRIGGAARLLGSALNLKPVLTVEDGVVNSLEKVRSRGKSLRRMLKIAEERLDGQRPEALAILHTEGGEDLANVEAMVAERLKPKRTYVRVLTPVVGTHGGPGTLGLAFYTM